MKKLFLRTGLFAGLAMSTIALASCGGSNEVELTDADGNAYKIAVTEDADTVSKAMVLAASSATSGDAKQYAFAVDAKANVNVTVDAQGVKGTVTADAKAFVGASIGKDAYKAYEMGEEGYAEADVTEATAAVKKGLGFLASAEGSVKFSNMSVSDDSEAAEDKDSVLAMNGKGAKGTARAFLNDGTFYVEAEANVDEGFAGAEKAEEYNYYGKAALPLDDMSPMIATVLHDFQTKSYAEFLEELSAMAGDYLPVSLPTELPLDFTINKDYFESEDFETIVGVVEALGVKISAINGSDVTFAVDITGKEVKEAVKGINPTYALILPSELDTEKNILSVSFTMNVVKGLVGQVKVSSDALDVLAPVVYNLVNTVISSMMGNQLRGMVNRMVAPAKSPWDSITGSFSFELNFKYDGDVNVSATPKNVTYVDLAD